MLKSLFRRPGATPAPESPAPDPVKPAENAAKRRVLRIGVLSPLGEFDPSRQRDSATSLILSQVFETLYAFNDAATGIQPLLASTLPRSLDPHGKRWGIPIRSDVVFSDGTPLTPALVAASLQRQSGFASQADVVAKEGEVEVSLRAVHPNFALFLTQTASGIALEKAGRFLGTGSFVLPELPIETVRTAEQIVLPRNPHDRDAASTGIDEMHVIRFALPTDLARALETGKIHFTDALPAGAGEDTGKVIYPVARTGISTGILFVNTQRPELRDQKVRQALLRAVNRGEIAKKSYEVMPMAYVATRLLPTALGEEGAGFPEGDAAAAKRVLGDATLPKSLVLLVTWGPKAYMPRPKEAAESIRAQISEAFGVAVEVVHPTRDEYYRRQRAGEYDLLLGGWIPDTPDPSDFYDSLLASSAVPDAVSASSSGNNLSRWQDADTDRLLGEHRADPSVPRRTALVKRLVETGVLTPLLLGKVVAYVSWDLKRVTLSALGRAQFRGATVHVRG